jgi:probable HAF family extracellular repeat protein
MRISTSTAGRHSVRLAVVLAIVSLDNRGVPTQSTTTVYGIHDLGTLGGSASEAMGISEFGYSIAGSADTAAGARHAFVKGWAADKDLGTLGGATSVALAAYGADVVGRAQTASGAEHAFYADSHSPTPMLDLGTLGGTWSSAYDVRYGVVVGGSRVAGDAKVQAFAWRNGTMATIPVDRGGDSEARGVNSSEDIVGYSCTAGNSSCTAFLFTGGAAIDLGSLGGNSVAHRVNDWLQIVGTSAVAPVTTAPTRAFLHQSGAMIDLGTLGGASSEGLAINNRGEVVGTAQDASGAPRAFLWRAGVMTDLNTVLPAGSGWVLTVASGISDGGQIVGTGLLNGVTRAFLLTPATDLAVVASGVRSQMDSNLPRGVEVGKTFRVVLSVQALTNDPVTVYGARLTDTLTGPAEYVAVQTNGDAECEVTPATVTCDVKPVDAVGLGREILLTVRTTGPGDVSHQATVRSGAPDPAPGNDSASESNYAVALTGLSLTPGTIAGGKPASARVTLTGIAPRGDAVVRMSSSRPEIASVPATFVVPSWTDKREFNIFPAVVSQPTAVEITASYGLVTSTTTLTVLPPVLTRLYLTPTTIVGGCGTSAGKIVLSGSAPPGGARVSLSTTNASFDLPPAITVDEGSSTKTFTVTTAAVTTSAVGSVTSSYGGVQQTLNVTVRPIRVKTLTLAAASAAGGTTVTGTITLECPAAPGAAVVALSSSKAAVAAPAVSTVTIPAGATTARFSIDTSDVMTTSTATIYATVFGVRRGAALTVVP